MVLTSTLESVAAQVRAPAVSVIMPVRNGWRWLGEAVDSVRRQTLADFELIVVDDGSTDGSRETLELVARKDRRVRVIHQRHLGLAAALNRGLAEASAPLVARLDADDVAHETRLQRQAEFLARHDEIGIVGAWAVEIDRHGRPRGRRTPDVRSDALKRRLVETNPFVHSSIMARAELLRELGGYRAAFEAAEDYDLWLRAAEVTELANLPEFLVSYRVHDDGVSRRDPLRQAFSVRLAQRAAAARRERAADPADALDGPPDWRCAMASRSFYAEDASLYRWLDLEPGEPSDRAPIGACAEGLVHGERPLNHAERRLAARAIWTRVRSPDPREAADARDLLMRLLRLSPAAVLRAAWSLRA
jgi:GT2 family glycosyltransferase